MSDTRYDSPFNLKEETKKINERAKTIQDPKARKAMVEQETKELKAHADMLHKMSQFVNAKSKNGKHPSGLR